MLEMVNEKLTHLMNALKELKVKQLLQPLHDVDSKDGHITEHVGNLVVNPAGKTIVKVGAKTKVEQSKDSEGHDGIDTTTYELIQNR